MHKENELPQVYMIVMTTHKVIISLIVDQAYILKNLHLYDVSEFFKSQVSIALKNNVIK